jgi:putative endonuclease
MHYTYVLLSQKDRNFYTGYTSSLKKRLKLHNDGQVTSTKHRHPFVLVYFEGCLNQEDAKRREKYLKSGNGKIYLKNRLRKYLNQDYFF